MFFFVCACQKRSLKNDNRARDEVSRNLRAKFRRRSFFPREILAEKTAGLIYGFYKNPKSRYKNSSEKETRSIRKVCLVAQNKRRLRRYFNGDDDTNDDA